MIVKGCVIFERALLSRKKSHNLAWSLLTNYNFNCALRSVDWDAKIRKNKLILTWKENIVVSYQRNLNKIDDTHYEEWYLVYKFMYKRSQSYRSKLHHRISMYIIKLNFVTCLCVIIRLILLLFNIKKRSSAILWYFLGQILMRTTL